MKFSVEQLYHFNCESCNKWWSIGDPPRMNLCLIDFWYCPWCGVKQRVTYIGDNTEIEVLRNSVNS